MQICSVLGLFSNTKSIKLLYCAVLDGGTKSKSYYFHFYCAVARNLPKRPSMHVSENLLPLTYQDIFVRNTEQIIYSTHSVNELNLHQKAFKTYYRHRQWVCMYKENYHCFHFNPDFQRYQMQQKA